MFNVQSSIAKLRFALGMGEAHNFNYSMNSLRSNSISYLVAQPKVETRYNKKTCMLFSLFVRNADMPAGLSFLLE